jgi:integrase
MTTHLSIREMRPGSYRLRYSRSGHRDLYRTVQGDRVAADTAGALWLAELDHYTPPPITQSATLGSVIRLQLSAANLAPATLKYYHDIIRLYIDPPPPETAEARAAWGRANYRWAIGRKQLGRITAQDGQDFQQHLIERFGKTTHTTGTRSIAEAMRLCSKALQYAVSLRVIREHPWKNIERVRPRAADITVPRSSAELNAVQRAGTGEHANATRLAGGVGRTGLLLRLALATGARRGEILALTWGRVDLHTGKIDIRGTLYQAPDGAYSVRPPKTRAGMRKVTVPPAMLTELRTLALATPERRDDTPLLQDAKGGWWSPAAASQAARKALHRAGLNTSLHALRHSNASLLMSGRISPEAVRRRLGHGSVTTTLKYYAHEMAHDEPAAAAAVGLALDVSRTG